jgi:hypothetical protein
MLGKTIGFLLFAGLTIMFCLTMLDYLTKVYYEPY